MKDTKKSITVLSMLLLSIPPLTAMENRTPCNEPRKGGRMPPEVVSNEEAAKICCSLGLKYLSGADVKKDEERAAQLYQQAANLGNGHAYTVLGGMYLEGKGVSKDERKAAELYQQAIEMVGSRGAYCNLGIMHLKGQGVEKDTRKAFELLQQAASQGDTIAHCNLALMYIKGDGVEKNSKKAVNHYHQAAVEGNKIALYQLGVMYLTGEGVERDEEKGRKLIQRSMDSSTNKEEDFPKLIYRKFPSNK